MTTALLPHRKVVLWCAFVPKTKRRGIVRVGLLGRTGVWLLRFDPSLSLDDVIYGMHSEPICASSVLSGYFLRPEQSPDFRFASYC